MMYRMFFVALLTMASVFCGFAQNPAPLEVCEKEKAFIEIFLSDPDQQRDRPRFDTTLHRIARKKAMEMAQRLPDRHTRIIGFSSVYNLIKSGRWSSPTIL